jgi:hypothetical protein
MARSTVFTLSLENGDVYYIDYDQNEQLPYIVSRHEKFRIATESFGEALASIFDNLGSIDFIEKTSAKPFLK